VHGNEDLVIGAMRVQVATTQQLSLQIDTTRQKIRNIAATSCRRTYATKSSYE